NNKRIEIGLTYIYGIGLTQSQKILAAVKISPDTRVKDLTEAEEVKLREYIDKNMTVEGDLQRTVAQAISRLKEIGSYKGLRHKNNLPVHGQRTKTNARTKRGKRVTMGSGRKKSASKT
ncbi:MAG TPA: 30S ribosomal protein S13, partial [Candidatus Polarisedimenticolaceae bacterium]|nr:30S ribosomal protein S13 [Candidatus Polarisedimenticolaceae bacterium]